MSFILAITISVSVWTFSGDNTWTPAEWRQIFKSTQEFYDERLEVRLNARYWKNSHSTPCRKYFRYRSERAYGNCLYRREVKPYRIKTGHTTATLLLTGPIPLGHGDTGVGGLSTGICQPVHGIAMIHGKRISTHVFDDGGNAGWEMTRLAVIHEVMHLVGANHPEDVGRATPINIMDTEALGYLVDEYQVKVNGGYENFRDVLPLSKFSKNEVKKCLGENNHG